MKTVNVDLGARSYDIVIGSGLLGRAADYIAPLLKNKRVGIITDETVAGLHLKTLTGALDKAGISSQCIILPPGEAQKSFETLTALMSKLLDQGYERGDYLLALGGGVIGDLTGFAASILKRGCGFIQIPTTLLAQVDSSVGGKTAINTAHGKNLIGAFYQPSLVLTDTDVLATLPPRELQAGYAEVLKYGLLGNADFFRWLDENGPKVIAGDSAAQSYAIAVSCQTKAEIVAQDEFEHGKRALLNLGHTFGHALEAEAGYNADLLHGEAVATGMAMAFDYCAAQNICSHKDAEAVRAHLKKVKMRQFKDLPVHIRSDANTLLGHMDQDKKNSGGKLTLILAKDIGQAYVEKNADRDSVARFLQNQIKEAQIKKTRT